MGIFPLWQNRAVVINNGGTVGRVNGEGVRKRSNDTDGKKRGKKSVKLKYSVHPNYIKYMKAVQEIFFVIPSKYLAIKNGSIGTIIVWSHDRCF